MAAARAAGSSDHLAFDQRSQRIHLAPATKPSRSRFRSGLRSPDMGCLRLLFEQRACRSTARTAPIGPVCCKAAKTVPKPIAVDFVGDFWFRQLAFAAVLGSQLGLRRNSMQPPRRRQAADRMVLQFDYG